MTEAEIEILVLAAQSGQRKAMDKLYRHFQLPMRKFAYLRVNNAMIADDLVQNVWLKVAKRILRLNDVSLFRSWLYRALRWEITDWHRATQKEVLVAEHDDAAIDENGNDDARQVRSLLQTLDKAERETAELFYLHDVSVREIALILGIPDGTVKSRLHRAREQLRVAITQDNQEK